ncbi:LPXTG-motif protein cell wall anchor domain protein, partial [Gardnerella vaginalis JCP8151A]
QPSQHLQQTQPESQPQHKATLPRTGTTVSSLVLMGSVLVAMGVLLQVSKRKD